MLRDAADVRNVEDGARGEQRLPLHAITAAGASFSRASSVGR